MVHVPLRVRFALVSVLLSSGTIAVFALVLYWVMTANLLREIDRELAANAQQFGELLGQATMDVGSSGSEAGTWPNHVVAAGIVAKLITPAGTAQILAPSRSTTPFPDVPVLIAAGRAG